MKGWRKEGSEFWTRAALPGDRGPCPAAPFGSKCEAPHRVHGCLMGIVCNEDPQVSGVGFVYAVAFLIANQETLL